MLITNKAWAIISNIINPKRINLLKNLYHSKSKAIPKKIECNTKKTAEPTPKNKKNFTLLTSSFIFIIRELFAIQYLINKIAVTIMAGLKIRYAG